MPTQNLIGHDVEGNPIYDNSPATASTTKQAAPETPTPSKLASAGNKTRSVLDDILPMLAGASGTELGATGGTLVGGPLGGLVGGIGGGFYSYLLAKKGLEVINGDPSTYKANLTMNDLKDAGINQAFESGIPLVIGGSKRAANFLSDHPLLRSIVKTNPQQNSALDQAAITATPKLNRSIGETLGSKPLQTMETQLGKDALVNLRTSQGVDQKLILDKLKGTPLKNPEEIGKLGQQALGNAFASSKASYQSTYDQFERQVIQPNTVKVKVVTGRGAEVPTEIVDPNDPAGIRKIAGPPTPGQPIIEERDVPLPIHLGGTANYTQKTLEPLNKFLSPENYENLPGGLQRAYKATASLLRDAANPTDILATDGSIQSIPFKGYEAIKETRTQIGRLIGRAKGQDKKLLTGLSQALDGDIDSALTAIDPSGVSTGLRNKADAAFAAHQDIYKPVMDRVYQGNPALRKYEDPSEMFHAADTDPAVARQLRAAFKPVDLPILKTGMMSQAIDSAFDAASGTTNIDQIINKISSPGSSYKSVFTPSELQNTETLLRGMRSQNPGSMQSGRAVSFTGGHIAFALGGSAVGALTGRDTTSRVEGALGGGALMMIAPSMFVNKILLNPAYARMVAGLPKVAADSQAGQLVVKTLLNGALRGAQVIIGTPDGKQQNAHVDKDGRISLDEE